MRGFFFCVGRSLSLRFRERDSHAAQSAAALCSMSCPSGRDELMTRAQPIGSGDVSLTPFRFASRVVSDINSMPFGLSLADDQKGTPKRGSLFESVAIPQPRGLRGADDPQRPSGRCEHVTKVRTLRACDHLSVAPFSLCFRESDSHAVQCAAALCSSSVHLKSRPAEYGHSDRIEVQHGGRNAHATPYCTILLTLARKRVYPYLVSTLRIFLIQLLSLCIRVRGQGRRCNPRRSSRPCEE